MNVLKTNLQDVRIVETDVFGDHRGFFTETYTKNKFVAAGIDNDFTQDNQSLSVEPGVLRGMHYQLAPYAQTKLLRAITGVIYDVLVDVRKGSPTYGQWEGYILSEYNHRQLLVPKGFAHGFVTLTPNVNVAYKVDGYYEPKADRGIAYDDPDIGIVWPMPLDHLVLSEKDQHHPRLKDAELNFTWEAKA
ncbi:dTDP-4-dehydrorhamnose 3,5-epimerase [Loigolactobacillus coryniformis subsp. coryniformis]|uniref:dTDP-4-dehydrorhamnose 3,5-epimerase n=1 Tax=Loigolactobacillus coryniformis subsp. coryniformis KCTC 3167 = DSM 20001 TaxID=913848 RepID=A0A0R1FCJ2_9LACO|nr:dTDP-4-dehydrorhamnose 3,5-epimerase [Loigolactobacillus coryniformis]ATO56473.1 dTDP-4-dehydrorhamnose 3,5-epimerase [Loigolactobacillus coryniformis subsp. coryniformis KCTC 3167 = DSM 20001]KRK19310.1 dTDP-4-dehydrorhamnose 3,5-epimerase [Loigolactobacillus coryniformis subsp. coryniformis KCTC 3167 = DSM 20001]OEH89431.1 dTDP-4-dehydrorhamnose 3,5-epimerase [Loigolactobacillus coryniformis subsp. coryniformis]